MAKSTLLAVATAIALAAFVIGCGGSAAPTAPAAAAPSTAAAAGGAPTAVATSIPTTVANSGQPTPSEQVVLMVSTNAKGMLLTDARGMTLYTYAQDAPDISDCTGDCAKKWLPLTVPQGITPASAQAVVGNLGVFERADGTYQVLYNDAPLYAYSGDAKPGDTNGDGIDKQWSVVVVPASSTAASSNPAAAIDWSAHGFPTVAATQVITQGTASNISAGALAVFVPADAFTSTVKLSLLTGPAASFRSHAPQGETPVLAFALVARDAATNALIARFNDPAIVTATDAGIGPDSAYYNLDSDGNFAINVNGMQAQAGELTRPIDQLGLAFVITTPSPISAATSTP